MTITYHHASITALRDTLSKLSHAFWRISPTYLCNGDCVRIDIAALEDWHQAVRKATLLLADDEHITDICAERLMALIRYNKEELTLAVEDIIKTFGTADIKGNKATESIIAGLRCHYLGKLYKNR